ncbi:Protein of uncharacterised function (DUF3114) [Streptococcus criceti]|uniref:Uncharacterized protein n=1 Tax=Streptococcus criceti HS-6 TaxID=873449 RepID=G5JRN1_STRCG|nr:DUF3114 domain-containing protein [Streptococcus criceti]EHI74722.1 hypothetical protein STRCR_2040 [Streptococcus criceti HS-6]SUN42878.1 Protein of uncharacterised function (DUF3114) [Streptococcus criceti]
MILKVHQFRYVISQQQVQYIRDNYRESGMTDEQALAAYLSTMEEGNGDNQYSLSESSRAHNKVKFDKKGKPSYPEGSKANYKVTIGFHSEFIVDQNGNFLNEVDPEGRTDNGTINGASFNYAEKNDDLHEKLDGNNAIGRYDPGYRKTKTKGYYAPNDLKTAIHEGWEDFKSAVTKGEGDEKSWDDSYWNSEGSYSKNGMSSRDRVNNEADEFRGMIESY